ncbi:hypothetical protein BKA70DRAFT_1285772, partial [Coprinopsis sp. MPI-PUGE-AT-0042]
MGPGGMPVCLRENSEAGWTWWRFEPYSEALSAISQRSLESDQKRKECITGPKDEPIKSDSFLTKMEESRLAGAPVAAPENNDAQSNTDDGASASLSRPNLYSTHRDRIDLVEYSSCVGGNKPNTQQESAQDRTSGLRSTARGAKKAKQDVVVRLPSDMPEGVGSIHSSIPTAPFGDQKPSSGMTDIETKQKIAADVKELFSMHSVDKAETYFEGIPVRCHKELVQKLTAFCIKSKASETFLVSAVFERVSTKGLCSALAFEQAFVAIAARLKGLSTAYPLANELFVILVVFSQLDADACRRIARSDRAGKLHRVYR